MSWRFRKTFKVLPGVKLNLTARGLSATLGASPLSINVGPRGIYQNVRIPGMGIWDRQRIGGPSAQPLGIEQPVADRPGVLSVPHVPSPVSPSPGAEIHSASTEQLSSENLEQLRQLLTEAYIERDELTKEISRATPEAKSATRRHQNWERGFLMKRLFKQAFASRKETAETADAKLLELREQLRLTTIATEIAVDREQAEPYYRMRDEFASLSECKTIWNVLTEKSIDRIAERSTAASVITRNPVSFSLDSCDLIQWEQKVPHLQNQTGGDMYVYPGFILYRASQQAFALIDFRVARLTFASTHFTERDPIPSDAPVIGHTWDKANKDGSPDRRFQNNHQIPVVHYGSLTFASGDGLHVRYMCSNAALAERFAKAWTAFRMTLGRNPRDVRNEEVRRNLDNSLKTFRAAKGKWLVADEPLRKAMRQAKLSEDGVLPREHVTAYMVAVVELVDAARCLMESLDPCSVRIKLSNAIEDVEVARRAFDSCPMDTNTLSSYESYTQAVFVFGIAITEVEKAVAAAYPYNPSDGFRSN